MQILSLVWGVLAFFGMIVGFIPCLGALNWLVIPFAAVGLFISIVAFACARAGNNNAAAAGIVLNAVALVAGTLRLMLGGGIL